MSAELIFYSSDDNEFLLVLVDDFCWKADVERALRLGFTLVGVV